MTSKRHFFPGGGLPSISLSRRAFIQAIPLVGLAGCSGLPMAEEREPVALLDGFMRLSGYLAADPNLSPKLGIQYLRVAEGFASSKLSFSVNRLLDYLERNRIGSAESLSKSDFFADPTRAKLADFILDLWYAGVYLGDHGLVTVTWNEALAWTNLGFARAPGVCGGAFGFWAEPVKS